MIQWTGAPGHPGAITRPSRRSLRPAGDPHASLPQRPLDRAERLPGGDGGELDPTEAERAVGDQDRGVGDHAGRLVAHRCPVQPVVVERATRSMAAEDTERGEVGAELRQGSFGWSSPI
jgi:hypothetical protein